MPTEYTIDRQKRLVCVRVWGVFTDQDAMAYQKRLTGDPGFDSTFHQIVDFSQVKSFELSSQGVRGLIQNDRWSSTSKRAVVAPEPLAFGMSRMYEIQQDGARGEIRVFKSRGEALDWLD